MSFHSSGMILHGCFAFNIFTLMQIPIRILFHSDADLDPNFQFDVDLDPGRDPASKHDVIRADPDPQHWLQSSLIMLIPGLLFAVAGVIIITGILAIADALLSLVSQLLQMYLLSGPAFNIGPVLLC